MCTYNTLKNEIVKLRQGPPEPVVAYKACVVRGKKYFSGRGYEWKLGWNYADGDFKADAERYDSENNMIRDGWIANGRVFHVSRDLQSAQNWVRDSAGPAGAISYIFEVLVDPNDIMAMGRANSSHDITDLAVTKCYVKSFNKAVKPPKDSRKVVCLKRAKRVAKLAKPKAKKKVKK